MLIKFLFLLQMLFVGRLESAKEQNADETVEMYRENLSKLLTKHSPTVQSLVEEYRDLWNQNITRFNYINELGNEVSVYDDDDENSLRNFHHSADFIYFSEYFWRKGGIRWHFTEKKHENNLEWRRRCKLFHGGTDDTTKLLLCCLVYYLYFLIFYI